MPKQKSYIEADPLELLVKKREDLPTVEELKDYVAKAETAVAEAVEKRDFDSAASLQAIVDNAKRRLEDTLAAEATSDNDSQDANENVKEELPVSIDGFESRASDLERERVDLQSQMKQAIARKDFNEASSLHSMLDEREKLREHFRQRRSFKRRCSVLNRNWMKQLRAKTLPRLGSSMKKLICSKRRWNLKRARLARPWKL